MERVLITGLSGTGKSTVIAALAARGYKTVDTDYDGWSEIVEIPADPLTGVTTDQRWREDRIARLLATEDAAVLFVSGAAPNQSTFYDRFDHVVLLSAPVEVMRERMRARTNNPFGKDPADLARALALKATVEPLLRRAADVEIDTSVPVDEVVERIVEVVSR